LSKKNKISYKTSGVDVKKGDALINLIKPFAKKTNRAEIMEGIGGFSAITSIPKRYKDPLIVSATDGVGTKIEIAELMKNHSTIGEDLVAMCVNDLITCGAEPLFFLDYLVTEKINLLKAKEIIKGIAKGCEIANCSLIGGETAEHPNAFPKEKYDLAGFSVGVVEKKNILRKNKLKNGDLLISLKSSGLHSNGFSLIRELIKRKKLNLKAKMGSKNLGEILLHPTKIYVKEILELQKNINLKAIAHITGGGLIGNLKRIIPEKIEINLFKNSLFNFNKKLFSLIQEASNLSDEEMLNTFNCGNGMVIVISENELEKTKKILIELKIAYKVIGACSNLKKGNSLVNIN
tara:strand:- start:349 stop:1392 length:1044 start_codon:yes stop_codon:yes gene_type:complete